MYILVHLVALLQIHTPQWGIFKGKYGVQRIVFSGCFLKYATLSVVAYLVNQMDIDKGSIPAVEFVVPGTACIFCAA